MATNCRRNRKSGRLAIGEPIIEGKTMASQSPRQWHPIQDPDLRSRLDEQLPRWAVDRREIRVATLSVRGVPTGTGPVPVDGPSHEAAADGVEMDVIDRGQDRLFGREIAIVSRPFLPEAERFLSRPLRDGELRKE